MSADLPPHDDIIFSFPNAMRTLIDIRQVCKSYGRKIVLQDVCLRLAGTGCMGIAGPNGAGKSTLIHLLLGLSSPDKGTIQRHVSPLRTGAVLTQHGLMDGLGYVQNLRIIYAIKQMAYDAGEVNRYMEALDMSPADFARPLKTYSAGMKQKLSIVSALIGRPELVIMDEPLNSLDIDTVTAVRNLILESKKSIFILLTGHILTEMEKVCDQVVFLRHQGLAAPADVPTLLRQYKDLEDAYQAQRHAPPTRP